MDDIISTDKQIEQILQQITVIPEQAADGIVVIDLAGIIRFVNPAWAAMHGYNATDKLIGRHISEFHTEEQMKTLVADFIEEAKRRGQLAGPIEHMRSDETVFYSQTQMTTARSKEGKAIGLVIFASDNTHNGHVPYHLRNQTTANEQLQDEIAERERIEQQLRQQATELKAADIKLEQMLTEQKRKAQANAEKAIAEIKAEYEQQLANVKTEAEQAVNEHKQTEVRLKQRIVELTAANEKLQDEITKQRQVENALKEDRGQLEQRIARQITELTAASEQLQQEIAKRKQTEHRLRQRANELTAANKQIQQTSTEYTQLTQCLSEQSSQLTAMEQQLQQEIARRRQAEENLAQLKAKLDNIHSIARKYL